MPVFAGAGLFRATVWRAGLSSLRSQACPPHFPCSSLLRKAVYTAIVFGELHRVYMHIHLSSLRSHAGPP